MVTLIHMAPKIGSAADLDGPHGPKLLQRHPMNLAVRRSMRPEDIGYLKRAFH
jgi:hypothetical protein